MPETGYNEIYDRQGNVIESIPITISDDQLLLRECEQDANAYHTQALQALRNWDSLTLAQKDKVLKFLLQYYLTSGQRQGYFTVT